MRAVSTAIPTELTQHDAQVIERGGRFHEILDHNGLGPQQTWTITDSDYEKMGLKIFIYLYTTDVSYICLCVYLSVCVCCVFCIKRKLCIKNV